MLAVHLERGKVRTVRRPLPRRPAGFARIRLLCAGICNTDIELRRGYYGFRGTPGHEFVGEVVEADTPDLVGRRVVGEINLACGACEWCHRGLGRHCPKRTVLGIVKHPGAMAEYFTLPERNLHPIPPAMPLELAVFTEPLAAACEILDQVDIPPNERVAVLGDGKLGMLIAQVLTLHGARVHLFGRHQDKMNFLTPMGVYPRLAGRRMPAATYDFVVEATGSPGGLKTAVAMTRPRGTVILKSTVHGDTPLDAAAVVVPEITMIGSRCGRFEPALKLIAGGRLRLWGMIEDTLPLAKASRAFSLAETPGARKVLLVP